LKQQIKRLKAASSSAPLVEEPAKPSAQAEAKEKAAAETPKPAKKPAKSFDDCMASANAALAKKDWDVAMWNFWRAAEADPKSPAPYLGLAQAYISKGESFDAKKAYEKALELGAPADQAIEAKLAK